MELSDDQMVAVTHGLGRTDPGWSEVERPTGRIDLPAWLGDVHVDWMEGYANSPKVYFKQVGPIELGQWRREHGKVWIRYTADGLVAEKLVHDGALSKVDGAWRTTRQDGFGGRVFVLDDVEGLGRVELHGPWFGGQLPGFSEMIKVDMSTGSRNLAPYYSDRPWHGRGGTFGLYVADELKIKALARHLPHLRIARLQPYPGSQPEIQPFPEEWSCPKQFLGNKPLGE